MTDEMWTFGEQPEPFPDLPALAERLSVPKLKPGEQGAIVLSMKNGDSYSLFAIINAVLNRLDMAERYRPRCRCDDELC